MKELIKNKNFSRPEPVLPKEDSLSVNKKDDKQQAAEWLISGKEVVIEDQFHTGMMVLAELKKKIFGEKSKQDFTAYRETRSKFHEASNRLLVPVKQHQIALKKSPEIGWLDILYPDVADFLLPFPQVQGLNSSWQWYQKGISYPGLNKKFHPFYGTYFPTRFDHLRLFWNWLKNYSGIKNSAIDVGTGCGVLAFQLLSSGFEFVQAVDVNPNAIISVQENAERFEFEGRLDVRQSDLFEKCDRMADLIVFNPPWLPAQKERSGLDEAIYYEPGLFERFFDQAEKFLQNKGRIVLLFSNLAEHSGLQEEHPVERELSNHKRFKKTELLKKKAARSSKKTKRKDHRKKEFVELWVLERSVGTSK